MNEFLKDIFTLRTVWIDQGGGKWKVKKRFHPIIRGILILLCVFAAGIVYANLDLLKNNNAEAVTKNETIIKASLPKPEKAPERSNPKKNNSIVIPLNTEKKNEAKKIILPSENSDRDRIIKVPLLPNPSINNRKNNDNNYRIFVSKSNYTLSLFKGDELVKEYPVAVGKNPGDKQRRGDNRTPTGNFKIVSIENASKWKHDFGDGKGKIAGAYGPWFLRLDAKGWKGIGIHGTHDPDSRGTMATEGCIRLSNEDINELKQYAYRNMPVTISED